MPIAMLLQVLLAQSPVCRPPASGWHVTWSVEDPCLLTCNSDACFFEFDTIVVETTGSLTFDDTRSSTAVRVRNFIVDGGLYAGTSASPFRSDLTITLTGTSADQDNPDIHKFYPGGNMNLPFSKVLVANIGATVALFGQPKTPWIKLASTAAAGTNMLNLAEAPHGCARARPQTSARSLSAHASSAPESQGLPATELSSPPRAW